MIEVPTCYDRDEYLAGMKACENGDIVPPETMNESFIAGYSHQYELEQIETARSEYHAC